jgi:hypothetical protein
MVLSVMADLPPGMFCSCSGEGRDSALTQEGQSTRCILKRTIGKYEVCSCLCEKKICSRMHQQVQSLYRTTHGKLAGVAASGEGTRRLKTGWIDKGLTFPGFAFLFLCF